MQGMYFDELEVGRELTSPRRTVTEADIVFFTCLTGLLNPLFTDDLFAKEQGFGTRVAPGPLIVSFAIGLTDELVYRTVSALLGIDKVRFISPVRPGDTIWVKTTVLDKRESASQPDRGPATMKHEVQNHKGETVCTLERTAMFLKRQ